MGFTWSERPQLSHFPSCIRRFMVVKCTYEVRGVRKKWIVLYAIPILWYAAPLAVKALGPTLPSGLVIVWCALGAAFALGIMARYVLGLSFWIQDKYPEAGVFSDGWGLRAARERGRAVEDFTPEKGDAELDRRRREARIASALFPVTAVLAVAWFLTYTGFFG